MKMILHTDLLGALGNGGDLLFHVPEDLAYFKEVTEGNICLMGRKTFDSLPFKEGLPNRQNWVLSRTPRKHCRLPNISWFSCPTMVELLSQQIEKQGEEVWVIGGADIYNRYLDIVDEVHHVVTLTEVEVADTYISLGFLEEEGWVLEEQKWLVENQTKLNIYKYKEDI